MMIKYFPICYILIMNSFEFTNEKKDYAKSIAITGEDWEDGASYENC